MAGNEESDIVGKYKMYKEQQMEEMLQAMGYTYTSRRAIMIATKYFKIEKYGEYWQTTEYIKSNIVKESWSLKFRSGKKFSWTARNGTKVKSLITMKDNKFEFRHDPGDLQEYRTLHGEMEFFGKVEMVMKMREGEVEGLSTTTRSIIRLVMVNISCVSGNLIKTMK